MRTNYRGKELTSACCMWLINVPCFNSQAEIELNCILCKPCIPSTAMAICVPGDGGGEVRHWHSPWRILTVPVLTTREHIKVDIKTQKSHIKSFHTSSCFFKNLFLCCCQHCVLSFLGNPWENDSYLQAARGRFDWWTRMRHRSWSM